MSVPLHRRVLLGLCGFAALSCLAGSGELLAFPHGNVYVPRSLLAPTPFPDFIVPGVLLGFVGLTQVVAVLTLWLRRAAVEACIFAGGALALWIAVEMALMRVVHPLHALYGGAGVAIVALALGAAAAAPTPRTRWLVAVTLGEGLGYLAPCAAGIALARAEVPAAVVVAVMASAGAMEGALLGLGQARGMPFAVPTAPFVAATAAGAALVWALVMGVQQFAERGGAWGPGAVAAAVLAGGVALTAIGGTQWWVLRRVRERALGWIAWTALAWALALPLSFLPAPLVDEATPLFVHAIVWPAAGFIMAHAMAWATWPAARRLAAAVGRSA